MARKTSNKDDALNRTMGFQIFRMRRRKGWTVKQLANRAGVHPNTVSNAENGCGASTATVSRLAAALKTSVGKLIPKSQEVVAVRSRGPLFD